MNITKEFLEERPEFIEVAEKFAFDIMSSINESAYYKNRARFESFHRNYPGVVVDGWEGELFANVGMDAIRNFFILGNLVVGSGKYSGDADNARLHELASFSLDIRDYASNYLNTEYDRVYLEEDEARYYLNEDAPRGLVDTVVNLVSRIEENQNKDKDIEFSIVRIAKPAAFGAKLYTKEHLYGVCLKNTKWTGKKLPASALRKFNKLCPNYVVNDGKQNTYIIPDDEIEKLKKSGEYFANEKELKATYPDAVI